MLKTPLNEWTLKTLQLETALMALEEIELPAEMRELQGAAREKLEALTEAWSGRKPAAEPRQWKKEALEGGMPKDSELAEVARDLKGEKQAWTLHRATSERNETVETLVCEDRAWMVAGGEYYFGQWDVQEQLLEVGRDDEAGEPGTGLVLTLTGELVLESDDGE